MDKIDAAIARLRTGSLMAERYTGKPMVITYSGGKVRKSLQTDLWHNAEDVMRWWLEDPNVEGQMTMEELIAEGSGEA